MPSSKNILIIKHGAFGDLIQSLGPMRAIRAYHPHDKITLLTTAPYASLMNVCPFIDFVYVDSRPGISNPIELFTLRKFLKNGCFSRVYDLQNSDRSCLYFYLMGLIHQPEWIGTAIGASHRNRSKERTTGRAFDGHVQTLALAGITNVSIDPLEWIKGKSILPVLPKHYLLIVPGCSPQHLEKRWPIDSYTAIAHRLSNEGITPVIIGSTSENSLAETIASQVPGTINLCGKTDMSDLPDLARGAMAALGNDTGPMHMIAVTGCPSLTLFDARKSNPVRHQPLGTASHALCVPDLSCLDEDIVFNRLKAVWRASLPEPIPESHTVTNQSAAQ